MFKFTTNVSKAVAVAAMALVAANVQAQDEKLYLCDVATEAELTQDICGVPMLVESLGNYQYRARYFNREANTPIFFLSDKTSFDTAFGGADGGLEMGSRDEITPIVLPLANTYYEIWLDTDAFEYTVTTYTVEDYMDPVFYEIGTLSLNTWDGWESHENGNWVAVDDAWWQEFNFGFSTGPSYVIPFSKDADNPHLYYTMDRIHFDGGLLEKIDDEGEVSYDDLSFIVHNWHSHGWWNYVTWRVDDSSECDAWYYYGYLVKPEYLQWQFGEDADFESWVASEDYRKQLIYGGGSDQWAKPDTNGATGDYRLVFDTHLGRGKLVPYDSFVANPAGLKSAVVDNVYMSVNGRVISFSEEVSNVRAYSLTGMTMNLSANAGNRMVIDAQSGIYVITYTTASGNQAAAKVVIR